MILLAVVVAAFAFAVGDVQALTPAVQTSPLTGAWTELSASGPVKPTWGPRFTTTHDAGRFTVVSPGRADSYALDGTAVDTPLTWTACRSTARRVRAEYQNGQIVITEWLVTTSHAAKNRAHGPCVSPDDEEGPGPSIADMLRPAVALQSITTVTRSGNLLVVEVTRPAPSAGLSTAATTYRPVSN